MLASSSDLKPVEPLAPVGPRSLLGGVLAEVEEVLGVAVREGFAIAGLRGALGRELAHSVEHPEPRLRVVSGVSA